MIALKIYMDMKKLEVMIEDLLKTYSKEELQTIIKKHINKI